VDNVTHTLIGLIAGEAVARHSHAGEHGLPAAVRRTLLVTVAVIGSNSPDLDLAFSARGASPSNLNYMLWHRGYTHTVPGCLALALLLYGGAEAWLRWRRLAPTRRDRALLLGTALFTTALHLGMDYLNSYGVHPFWPVDNRWSYGDSVFIVEPLYWAAAAPLFFLLRTVVARALFAAALIGAILLGIVTELMSVGSCAVLALSSLVMIEAGRRLSAQTASRLSLALSLIVTAMFVGGGRLAAQRADALALAEFPNERLIDHVLTPFPANPVCWDVLLLETQGDRYVARHAHIAIAPRLLAAPRCSSARTEPHTAPLTAVVAADSAGVRWLGQFEMPRSALRLDAAADCKAAAFMLFSRAPFVADALEPAAPEERAILGDLRFDQGRERGSFEVPLVREAPLVQDLQNRNPGAGRPPACGRAAPWIAPRIDLLSP
jgi:inner membrane protein